MCHLCPYTTTGLQQGQWLHSTQGAYMGTVLHAQSQVLTVLSWLPLPQAPPKTHWMTSGRWCGNTIHPSLSCTHTCTCTYTHTHTHMLTHTRKFENQGTFYSVNRSMKMCLTYSTCKGTMTYRTISIIQYLALVCQDEQQRHF